METELELARGTARQRRWYRNRNYSLPARHVGHLAGLQESRRRFIFLSSSSTVSTHWAGWPGRAGWMPTWQKEMSYCVSDLIYVSDRLTVTFLLPGPRSGPDNTEKLVWNIVKISSSQSDFVMRVFQWISVWLEGKPGGSSVFVYLISQMQAVLSGCIYPAPWSASGQGWPPPTGKIVPWPVSPSKMIWPGLETGLETGDNMEIVHNGFFCFCWPEPGCSRPAVATEKTKDRDGCSQGGENCGQWRKIKENDKISLRTGAGTKTY